MTISQWLGFAATFLFLALLVAAGIVTVVRRHQIKSPPQEGWLNDAMIRQIIRHGTLSSHNVPEEALNLEEIAREEERFWSETWDESEPYWE
jgi:hypothetical protein